MYWFKVHFYCEYFRVTFSNFMFKFNLFCAFSVAQFTTSRFGKPAIQMGPYRFNKNNRSLGPKVLWVCCRVSAGCRATITTLNDVIVKTKTVHNH